MKRNLMVAALVAIILAGLVLTHLRLARAGTQPGGAMATGTDRPDVPAREGLRRGA